MSVEPFNPKDHVFSQTKYFEDFTLGDRFYIPSRTQTEGLFTAFQAASGDNHPLHYDTVYCEQHGHKGLLAHGFQVAIQTCSGAGIFPHLAGDALLGFIEQSSKFLEPVYVGDTLYPMLEISELTSQKTTGILTIKSTIHNQIGTLIMEGQQKYLIRKRPHKTD